MRKFLLRLMLSLALIVPSLTHAQLSEMSFISGTDASKWVALGDDATYALQGAEGDSKASTLQNIGFSFDYAGTSYTQFSVNTDGCLRLGSTVTGTGNYSTPFSTSNIVANGPAKINGFGCDGYMPAAGYVKYQVIGTAPNRTLVVEFATSTYSQRTSAPLFVWQVQLSENGAIQLVYSPVAPSVAPTPSYQVGMSTSANDLMLVNVAAGTAAFYTSGNSTYSASAAWPTPGTYYTLIPSVCKIPSNAVVTYTHNSATLSWNALEAALSHTVEYGPAGFTQGQGTFRNVAANTNQVSISGLTEQTAYDLYVRHNCSEDTSLYKKVSFTTECAPKDIIVNRYEENFDDLSGFSDLSCWKAVGTTPSINTYYYMSQGKSLAMSYTSTPSVVVLPRFNAAINVTQISLAFRTSSEQTVLQIGTMSNPNDVSTFSAFKDLTPLVANAWQEAEVPMNTYMGANTYIAFRVVGSGSVYIDNIAAEITPSCQRPSNLAVSNITTSGAIVSWVAPQNAQSFKLEYGPAGFVPGNGTIINNIDAESYILSGLNVNTAYDVYVSSICGELEGNSRSKMIAFSTLCDLQSISFVENFNHANGQISTSTSAPSNYPISALPSCWVFPSVSVNNQTYPQLFITTSSAPDSALALLGTESNPAYAVAPQLAQDLNTLQVNVEYKGGLVIGYATDPYDMETFVSLDEVYSSGFDTYVKDLSLVDIPSGAYFVMMNNSTTALVRSLTLSDAPTCKQVSNIQVSNLTSTSATLTWDDSHNSGVQYVVVVNGVSHETNTRSIVLNDLSMGISYEVEIFATCGDGLQSVHEYFDFTTLCNPTLPYTEDFNSYVNGGSINSCWVKNNATVASPSYAYGKSIQMNTNGLLVLPQFTEAVNTLDLLVKVYKTNSNYGDLQVGLMTDPEDVSTFETIATLSPSTAWEEFEVPFTDYTGNGTYIAIKGGYGSYPSYVDDITVKLAPTCSSITGLTVDNIEAASAFIYWQPGSIGTLDHCIIEYKEADAAEWTLATNNATGNSYGLSGLTGLTSYIVRVTAVCASGDQADPITTSFNTPCLNPGLLTVGTGTQTNQYIPFYRYYNYGYSQQIYDASELTPGTISTIAFQVASNPNSSNMIVYLGETTKSTFSGVSDYVNASELTEVYRNTSFQAVTGWNTIELTTPFEYSGEGNLVLAFLNNTGSYTSSYQYSYVSNTVGTKTIYFYQDGGAINISSPSASSSQAVSTRLNVQFGLGCNNEGCGSPNVRIVEVTENSVDIEWLPGNTETSWYVTKRAVNAVDFDEVVTTTNTSYHFDNLLPATNYIFRVIALCGNYDKSSDVETMTNCPSAVAVPYSEDFDSYSTSSTAAIDPCWTKGTNYSTTYPYPSSSYAQYTGSKALYFYGGSYYSYVALPKFAADVNTLTLGFKAYVTSSNYGNIKVGVMTDPNDVNTFQLIQTVNPSVISSWNNLEVPFTNYQGDGYLAIMVDEAVSGYSNYVYIDDINVHLTPNCGHVENLSASNVSAASALVAWEPSSQGTPDHYRFGYRIQGENEYTWQNLTEPRYVFTGLQSDETYEVAVIADCGNNDESTPETITFTTAACASSMEIACGTGTTTSFYLPFYRYYDYSYSQQIYDESELQAGTISSIAFDVSSNPVSSNIDIYMGETSKSTFSSTSDYVPTSDLTLVYSGSVSLVLGWNTIDLSTPFQYSGEGNLVVAFDNNSGSYVSPYPSFRVSSTLGNKALYYYRDGTDINPSSPSGSNSVVSSRPNMKFMNCEDADCVAPAVIVNGATSNSVDLTIVPGYTETSWTISYKPTSSNLYVVAGTTSNTSYALSGLQSGVLYNIKVASNCTTGNAAAEVNATTLCGGTMSLPYVENFDSYTYGISNGTYAPAVYPAQDMPTCWEFPGLSTSSSSYPQAFISSYEGSNGLVFKSNGNPAYAILPRFAPNSLSELEMTFDHRGNIQVGYIEDESDLSSFVSLATYYDTEEESAIDFSEYDLSNANLSNAHIAFYFDNRSGYDYSIIDNVNVHVAPICKRITDLSVSNVLSSTATIEWNSINTGANWDVWMISNSDTLRYISNTTSFTCNNLDPKTSYEVLVRTNCGATQGRWSSAEFTTIPELATSPMTITFEESNIMDYWTIDQSATNHWTVGTAENNGGSSALYITNGETGAFGYNENSTSNSTASLFFSLEPGYYNLMFDWKCVGEQNYDYFIASIRTNADTVINGETRPHSREITLLNGQSQNEWTTFEGSFNVPTAGIYELSLYWRNDGSVTSGFPAAIDNISINNCMAPRDLVAEATAQNSVTLSWTDLNVPESWTVEYGAFGFSQGEGSEIVVTSNPCTISGLNPANTYQFRIKGNCGVDGSDWSNVAMAVTECGVITNLPYTYNFESAQAGTFAQFPNCWNRINSANQRYPYVQSNEDYDHNGTNHLYFYQSANTAEDQIVVLPEVDVNTLPMNGNQLKFWARMGANTGSLVVGVMTDPEDASTFVAVDTVIIAGTNFEQYKVFCDQYQGNGSFLAIKANRTESPMSVYVDDVTIDLMPSCPEPNRLEVSNITGTSMTLSWRDHSDANRWDVQYTVANATDEPQHILAISNPVEITGLEEAHSYIFSIRAICGEGDTSAWSNSTRVNTTLCTNLFIDTIGNMNSTTSVYDLAVNNDKNYSYTQQLILADEIHVTGSISAIRLDYAYAAPMTAKNNVTIYLGHTSKDHFSDVSDYVPASDLTAVYTGTLNCEEGWNEFIFDTPFAYNGTDNIVVAIDDASNGKNSSDYKFRTTTTPQVMALSYFNDNVHRNIEQVNQFTSARSYRVNMQLMSCIECESPVDLAQTSDYNSATLLWNSEVESENFEVAIRALGETEWNTVSTTNTTVTFNNLQEGTNYQWRVMSHCSATIQSDWVYSAVSTSSNVYDTICENATYNFNTKNGVRVLAEAGEYIDTVVSELGIEGVVILHLATKPVTYGVDSHVACESYTWMNGTTYHENTESPLYTLANANVFGCDSIVSLNLTINNATSSVESVAVCETYTWRDGETYTESTDSPVFTLSGANQFGCDSLITLNLTVNHATVGEDAHAACETYTWIDGNTYTESTNEPSILYEGANQFGCDSTVVLNLVINHGTTNVINRMACVSYTWIDGETYYESTNEPVYTLTDRNGCDSIVNLHLIINSVVETSVDYDVCGGYEWNGNVYTESGVYTQHLYTLLYHCDSIVTLTLNVKQPTASSFDVNACDLYFWDGRYYTISGTYVNTFVAANSCDSVVTMNLTINHPTESSFSHVACGSYTWNNHYYDASGSYTYTYTDQNGCDSVVTMNLTINQGTSSVVNRIACGSYTWTDGDGMTYTSSTSEPTFTFTGANGCDSVVRLNLTVLNSVERNIERTACESYTWNGITYTTSGNYTQNFQTLNGCDSIVTMSLTINQPSASSFNAEVCDVYFWDGRSYSTSGTYTTTYTAANGCDSVVTLNLIVNQPTSSSFDVTTCGSYQWNHVVYNASGSYTQHFTNYKGCDSVVTLNLTLTFPTASDLYVTACESYNYNGHVYNYSGNFTNNFTNANGCDSIVNLHLTINQPTRVAVPVTACDSYVWNGISYTSGGRYTTTFENADVNGCDSIVTLVLSINHSSASTANVSACDSYTWIDGLTYVANNNTATFTTLNNRGCDSIITLNLVIKHSSTGVDNVQACDYYTWMNGKVYATSNNTDTYTTENSQGCDSVIRLNLTMNYSSYANEVVTAHNSYYWNGMNYTESGVYEYHGITEAGCDSVVVLRLTITVGIDETADLDELSVYPNPTMGRIMINAEDVRKVEVLDIVGRVVATFTESNEIDITNLSAGTYTLRISLAQGTAVRKVVKR